MDSPKLRGLSRAQLQSLAKREVIRAIGKTEDIIRRLIRKHPSGVPVPEDADNPSASSAPPKRFVLKISRKGTPTISVVQRSFQDRADPKGKGKAVAQAASPSPSSSTEALELLYPSDENIAGPANANPPNASWPLPEFTGSQVLLDRHFSFYRERTPVPLPEYPTQQAHDWDAAERQPSIPGLHANEEELDGIDYNKGAPTHYMVVDALRQFTPLANTIPSLETRIAESRCLLHRTERLINKAIPEARELTVTREYLEMILLAKLKEKPELWDGTAQMEKSDRKHRMEWLRAKRKTENEKQWRETNEVYAKIGLEPLPFSAFASQSDEEVIESLQTTPTSCGSGSAKRSREESFNEDDGEDTDGEIQSKRARS